MTRKTTTDVERIILERWAEHDGSMHSLAGILQEEGVVGVSTVYRVIFESQGDARALKYKTRSGKRRTDTNSLPVATTPNPAQNLLDEVLGIATEVEGFLKAFAILKNLADTQHRVDTLAASLRALQADHRRLETQLRDRQNVIDGLVPIYAQQATQVKAYHEN